MNYKILPRSEIDPKYTWNLASIFKSAEAWKTELDSILESLSEFKSYQGRLSESPAVLADAMQARDNLFVRAQKVCTYASLSHEVDMTNQAAAKIASQAESLNGQVQAAISFIEPELLNIGAEVLNEWIPNEPRLARYAHYIHDLFRKQAFVRSAEVEELLGMLTEPFSGTMNTAGKLMNADLTFPSAATSDGGEIPITQNTIRTILTKEDRLLRQTAWERYTDTFLAFKNTFASLIETYIKQCVFFMHAYGHRSTLSASLFESNIPVEVFHNLLTIFRQHLPTWHRYWKIRRKALGVETLHPYDVQAPLTKDQFHIPYEQAVDWICKSLTPLGDDYVSVLRKGCLEDRWVDVYPSQGKVGGGFSEGSPGTHPFILLNYADDMFWFSGLAHELGHSMHSYLIWQHQPGIYCFDRKFFGEVPSNFHQAMLRAYLLEHHPDPRFQISLLEEAMGNFYRYLFIMPTLARFELEVHERVECGEGLSADDMIELMADLFAEGYGSEIHVDRERVGITWATFFPHLYYEYYVYQYAVGISGAYALSQRILSGQDGAVENYLKFLKAGNSMYPLDLLKMAGVDLTKPDAIEDAFRALAEMIDRLEKLICM